MSGSTKPGVMTGMMVSGASPVYAGIYQFIIVAMILAASGIGRETGSGPRIDLRKCIEHMI
jgi:hypothetical protein